MKTIKKIGLVSAVAFAMLAFSACDDSSSASSDETSVSSSSVETSDLDESSSSVDKKSSGNESTEQDKSSSSVKGSEPAEVSSSSAVKQSSSSSNVTQSSSSIVKGEYFNPSLSYSEFEDDRDHRVYKYLTIAGENQKGERASVTVMAENLNVGEMIDGTLNQSNESKIEKYCYNNDTAICLTYGGLYHWAEMMGFNDSCNTKSCGHLIQEKHRGICPDGWRLLTYDDFYIVAHADKNKNGVSDVRATFFGGLNYSGYTLIGAGYNWNYEFRNKDESAYWHYPEEGRSNDVNIASFVGLQTRSSKSKSTQDTYKTHGVSVRCVK